MKEDEASKPSPGAVRDEDAQFQKLLKKRNESKTCFSCLKRYVFWTLTLFGIPKLIFNALKFFVLLIFHCLHGVYAHMMWECCGVPVNQLNKNQYLLSRYTGQSGDVSIAFALLNIETDEQLKWMELWADFDDGGDDKMDMKEFHYFFGFGEVQNWLTERMFNIYNKDLNGFINFRDFLTVSWTYAPYDKERCVELSFRLLSRRGDVFDMDKTCLDLTDLENFIENRYNRKKKKSQKWVKNTAVSLYAHIDIDMSGGISYSEFRTFALENRIFLLYGYFFQSQLRKILFEEHYWKEATLSRRAMFKIDRDFDDKMMQMMDWTAVWGIGMALPGSLPPKDKISFKDDFNAAWYKGREKKFLQKKKKDKVNKVTVTLAAKTHARLIKIFSKIVPDGMTLTTAFATWKDVNAYSRSMEEDGGRSYSEGNMSLVDLRLASTALSLGRSTNKLNAALASEFDAEAAVDDAMKREESKKKKKEMLAKEVVEEVARLKPSDDDVVENFLMSFKGSSGRTNMNMKLGQMESKTGRIKLAALGEREVNTIRDVLKRKELRMGVQQYWLDEAAKAKENETDELSIPSTSTGEDQVIDGAIQMGPIGTLAALESVRMLAMPRLRSSGYDSQKRIRAHSRAKASLPR